MQTYVDDSILAINESNVEGILELFNQYNDKLEFTVEKKKRRYIYFFFGFDITQGK